MGDGNRNQSRLSQVGSYSIIKNNEVVKNIPENIVYVSSSSELDSLTDFPAGTFAIQYGLSNMWQKKPDDTWAPVGG